MRGTSNQQWAGAYGTPEGLAELRGEALRTLIALALASSFGLAVLGAVDVQIRRPELWGVILGLAATAAATHQLRPLGLAPAGLTLVTGLGLCLALALRIYQMPQLVYLVALVVLAGVIVLDIRHALAATAGASAVLGVVPVAWSADPGWSTGVVLALTWGSFALCWLATRPTRTALDWSWHSYVQSLRKTEELRDRQGELGRLSKSLAETCAHLEQANRELLRARQVADEARRLKAEFAAAISHELRTPLNLIIGFSEMMVRARHSLCGEVLPPGFQADVEAIYRNAGHISNLIDDVLDLSRVEAHRMALTREWSRLLPIVEEAVATVANLIGELGLDLVVDIPPGLPAIYVDRTRVKQILINLLNNAIRSTDRGGVTISASLAGNEVVVAVRDTGVGIAPEDLPQLFQEYSQIGGASRRGRSGLGLAVSKQFAELHGGTMWAESEPSLGSTFFVSLPLCDNVVASAFASEPMVRSDGAGGEGQDRQRVVMVLGQDVEATNLFRRYLDGYRVLCGAKGQDIAAWADDAARRQDGLPRAVMLTDSRAVDDWERLQRARPGASRFPVLTCFLTTTSARVAELGVVDYLTKPITRDQLHRALKRAGLSGKRLRRVLVVEDDADMVRLLAKMVESLSSRSQVYRAGNGREGLAQARDRRPDVILLDLLMPEMDGYDMLHELKADPGLRDVPVVIVTARGYQEGQVLGTSLGISRPGGLSVAEVMRLVRGSLDHLLAPPGLDIAPALPAGPGV
ncbi:MAG: response regulator [Chloroflexi bacterium]|nr:response regulator [Chloroflexota bacterium]